LGLSFDSDPSLISPVLRRTKKINGVAKSPENPANPAYRRLNTAIVFAEMHHRVQLLGDRSFRSIYPL